MKSGTGRKELALFPLKYKRKRVSATALRPKRFARQQYRTAGCYLKKQRFSSQKTKRRFIRNFGTLSDNEDAAEDLLKMQRFVLTENGLMLTNPEAHELIKRALKSLSTILTFEMVYYISLERCRIRSGTLIRRSRRANGFYRQTKRAKAFFEKNNFKILVNVEHGDIKGDFYIWRCAEGLPGSGYRRTCPSRRLQNQTYGWKAACSIVDRWTAMKRL